MRIKNVVRGAAYRDNAFRGNRRFSYCSARLRDDPRNLCDNSGFRIAKREDQYLVVRGSEFRYNPETTRCTYRTYLKPTPNIQPGYLGFRLTRRRV